MSAHDHCTHEKTKSARAACRRAAVKGQTAPVAPVVKPLATEIQTPVEPSHTTKSIAADVTVRSIQITAQLDSFQLEATREKISKINARAVRKGLAGMITMTVEPVIVKEFDQFTRLTREWTEYKVEISGNAPAYNGWEFIAKLDWDQHAGLIVRAVPFIEGDPINRDSVREGWCDHCKTTRQRSVTYVVRNRQTGETLQVGSSCLKDFTGQFTTVSFPQLPQDDEERDSWFGGCGTREFAPETVLAVAWACIKLNGFTPASMRDGNTTRDQVMTALYPSKAKNDREFAALIAPLADEAAEKAAECLNWIINDMTGDTDYVLNLKAVAAGRAVSIRNIGILASAPQSWARAMERTLIREREASVYATSEYIGEPKMRTVLDVEIKAIRYLDGDYGTKTLYTMVTSEGNVVKWFSSGVDKLGDSIGARYRIRATIASHDEWQSMKTTKLTRCTIVDELEPASA